MRALTTATGIPRRKQPLEQVGPELGLGQDEQAGLEGVQVGAHRPGQVERAIEDAVRSEALAGQRLAGAGGGGDQEPISGKSAVQLLDQAADGQHLADGDGVEPDDRPVAGSSTVRRRAEHCPGVRSSPSRYFCVVAIRHSHQGAPTTRAASNARL